MTPRKYSAIKESTIQKFADVSDDDEENIDTGNVKVELDKEKAKLDELAGKSLRQLAKMLKEMHIKSNKNHNTNKSATKVSLFTLTISVCLLSLVILFELITVLYCTNCVFCQMMCRKMLGRKEFPCMHCQRTVVSILLFKGLFLFGILIFFNSKIPLNPYVYAEIKLKDNSIKNTTLTPTKILPKK